LGDPLLSSKETREALATKTLYKGKVLVKFKQEVKEMKRVVRAKQQTLSEAQIMQEVGHGLKTQFTQAIKPPRFLS
jgi:hypothetical protein